MPVHRDVDAYIASFPDEVGDKLRRLRSHVRRIAPDAEETIAYGIPTYRLGGNIFHFAGHRRHIGLYPGPEAILAHAKALSGFKTSKGAIQVPLDESLPLELITRLIEFNLSRSGSSRKKTRVVAPATRQPGDAYWERIEKAFDALDLDASPGRVSARLAELDPRTALLLAGHWCQSEVCDGGLHQFFANSTGVLAPEALQAFEEIGAREWARVLREAMRFFGTTYPRSRSRRIRALPAQLAGAKRRDWDPFRELDDAFYRWLKTDPDRWSRAADAYAMQVGTPTRRAGQGLPDA